MIFQSFSTKKCLKGTAYEVDFYLFMFCVKGQLLLSTFKTTYVLWLQDQTSRRLTSFYTDQR